MFRKPQTKLSIVLKKRAVLKIKNDLINIFFISSWFLIFKI